MNQNLDGIRNMISKIDEEILSLVGQRLLLAQEIGKTKKKHALPIVDLKVEREVVGRAVLLGGKLGLDKGFVKRLINLLIYEATATQGNNALDRASYLYDVYEKTMEHKARGDKVIGLNLGEPDFISPADVKAYAKEALDEEKLTKYVSSKGLKELRDAIADDIGQEYGVDIDSEQVLITSGGKFALFTGILSQISSLDRVLIPEPCWPMYSTCVKLVGGRTNYIHTRLNDDWQINLQKIEEAFETGTKLLILNNPNNPTGKIIPPKDLTQITELAEKKGVYILSDEVYSSYAFKPFKSILETSNSNFIYVDSFSKKYGMTGWRIGFAISDVKTISKMRKIVQISTTCVPGFIQKAALKALTIERTNLDAFIKVINTRIKIACKELDLLPVSYVKPDGAMYLFPRIDIESINTTVFAHKLLSEKRVAVAPGEAFGKYPEHLRISLTTNNSNLMKGIQLIGEMLKEW